MMYQIQVWSHYIIKSPPSFNEEILQNTCLRLCQHRDDFSWQLDPGFLLKVHKAFIIVMEHIDVYLLLDRFETLI